jgi:hypothetical protein
MKPRSLNHQSRTSETQRRSRSSTLSGSSMDQNHLWYRATSHNPSQVIASVTVQKSLTFSCGRDDCRRWWCIARFNSRCTIVGQTRILQKPSTHVPNSVRCIVSLHHHYKTTTFYGQIIFQPRSSRRARRRISTWRRWTRSWRTVPRSTPIRRRHRHQAEQRRPWPCKFRCPSRKVEVCVEMGDTYHELSYERMVACSTKGKTL